MSCRYSIRRMILLIEAYCVMCEIWIEFLYKCGLILIFKGLHCTKPIPVFYIFPIWRHSKIIMSVTKYVTHTTSLFNSVFILMHAMRPAIFTFLHTLHICVCYALAQSFIRKIINWQHFRRKIIINKNGVRKNIKTKRGCIEIGQHLTF